MTTAQDLASATVVSTPLVVVAPYALSSAVRALSVGGLSPSAFRRVIFAALVSAAWPTLILYLMFAA